MALAFSSGAAQPAAASAVGWTKVSTTTNPSAVQSPSIAFDPAIGKVVLDTWTFDGSTWTQRHPAARPSKAAGASLAYDPVHRQVMMFGGNRDVFHPLLDDTWTWDGSNWTLQHPATVPPARYRAMMAFDGSTGSVVLFGGEGETSRPMADTWTWDGSNWTLQHPATGPPARVAGGLAWDPTLGVAVLFGGFTDSFHGYLDDTWAWDGSTWRRFARRGAPPARAFFGMDHDPAVSRVVMFGGAGKAFYTGTWEL